MEAITYSLRYFLLDHPKIRRFEWDPSTTLGASPTFLSLTVITYLTLTLLLSRLSNSIPALHPSLLRLISTVHNLILLLLSLFMVLGCTLSAVSRYPLTYLFCFPSDRAPPRVGPLFFWAYVYYLSKLLEFLDTLLILLNKNNSTRRLSFLHVYHHAVVVIMSYLWLSTTMSLFPVALVTNAGVHVVMYSYYLLCGIGVRPRWKRAVTNCQIVQFVFSFLVSGVMLYFHFRKGGCSGMSGWCFNAVFNASLLYLFIDFHSKNYASRKRKGSVKQS